MKITNELMIKAKLILQKGCEEREWCHKCILSFLDKRKECRCSIKITIWEDE